jgi:hypothetical protein
LTENRSSSNESRLKFNIVAPKLMLVLYSDHSYSYLEHLWKGIVKVDHSLISSAPHGHEYGDYTVVTINDLRYGIKDNAQFDNPNGLVDFPNEIVFFIKGNEFLERMQCTALKGYKDARVKKLFRSSYDIQQTIACKGFILEPTKEGDPLDDNVDACLALFQFDNEYCQDVSFERLGIVAFASGSQTSNMTMRDPRKSVTTAFVASNDKPLVAYVYLMGKTLKVYCDNSSPKSYEIKEKTRPNKRTSVATKDSALDVLKMRLASGEITIEEYERLRRIILEDDNYSSNWV